jgi:hypothetical protein
MIPWEKRCVAAVVSASGPSLPTPDPPTQSGVAYGFATTFADLGMTCAHAYPL